MHNATHSRSSADDPELSTLQFELGSGQVLHFLARVQNFPLVQSSEFLHSSKSIQPEYFMYFKIHLYVKYVILKSKRKTNYHMMPLWKECKLSLTKLLTESQIMHPL